MARLNSLQKKSILGLVLLMLTILFVLPLFNNFILRNSGISAYNDITYLISRISFWLCLLLIWIYAVRAEGRPLIVWEEKRYSIIQYIIAIIILFIVLYIGSILIQTAYYYYFVEPEKSKMINQLMLLFRSNPMLAILTAMTAGMVEELIFRAYIQTRLEEVFKNSTIAIIISSLVFGLVHMGYGTWINVIGPTFIGLVFAIFYKKFRNIKILIFVHTLWDLMVIYAYLYFLLD